MAMSSQVLLYSGPGADPFCIQAFQNQLGQILDKRFHRVEECSFSSGCFQDPNSISAVFVPGGNAVDMLCDNTEDARKSFKELFSKHHCSYYGACAGGILAASRCHGTFTLSNRDIQYIKKENCYLGLYPGAMLAPIFSKHVLGQLSIEDVHLRDIHLAKQETVKAVHVLSPAYLNVDKIQGAEILSSYASLPNIRAAADIIGMEGPIMDPKTFSESLFYQSGKARMVLTGSHPEIDSKAISFELFKTTFNATSQQQSEMVQQMEAGDLARQNLLRENFEKLGLHCVSV